MRTEINNIAASIFRSKQLVEKLYPNGIQNYVFLCTSQNGIEYKPLKESILLRGKDQGSIKFKITTHDYTEELNRRKAKFKIYSGSSKVGHISKMYPCGPNRFHGDFKNTNDKLLFLWEGLDLVIVVVHNAKHDYSLVNDWEDGKLDYLFK